MTATDLQIADLPARALFEFDGEGKLQATFLVFSSPAISTLKDALSAKYGAPVNVDRSWPETITWREVAKGTTIKTWHFPDSNKIVVEYRQNARGL